VYKFESSFPTRALQSAQSFQDLFSELAIRKPTISQVAQTPDSPAHLFQERFCFFFKPTDLIFHILDSALYLWKD
jgi:hypothetical protein